MSEDLNLGRLLGRREAFQIVAARCSAADAALMREIRDQKLYIGHAGDWGEFCVKHLHTSRENANRIIRMLDEFGPSYFAIAEITRISPATYRAIAPAVQDRKLMHNGETIDLIPENAEKVASAVAEMRKATPKPAPAVDPIPALDRRCHDLVAEFNSLVEQRSAARRLSELVSYLQLHLKRIEMTL